MRVLSSRESLPDFEFSEYSEFIYTCRPGELLKTVKLIQTDSIGGELSFPIIRYTQATDNVGRGFSSKIAWIENSKRRFSPKECLERILQLY